MNAPLNVLYVVTHGEIGGVERFLDSVMFHHDPARVRPVVLSFADGPWLGELQNRGLAVHCIPQARVRRLPGVTKAIGRILNQEEIHIVHSAYGWCHMLASPAAIRKGCRRVWFHHGPISDRRWQGFYPLIPADSILVNSEFLRSRFSRTWYLAKSVDVVYYGIDPDAHQPDRAARLRFRNQWSLTDEDVAVGIVGFIDTWKGQDVFIEAAHLLREEAVAVRMFIVGGPRPGPTAPQCRAHADRLRQMVRDLHVDETVVFTGHLDIRDGALDGLDVVVHASTIPEPFGMVILESMAREKPIIASAEGGPLEILESGTDGVLIEPRKPELLAQAITDLVADAGKRARLSSAARRSVARRFHPRPSAERLEELYERILEQ